MYANHPGCTNYQILAAQCYNHHHNIHIVPQNLENKSERKMVQTVFEKSDHIVFQQYRGNEKLDIYTI